MLLLQCYYSLTYNFFLKAYYAQPFNFRNQSECVYYWALKNERNWEFVKAIKLKIQEAQANVKEINVFDDKTILIGKALDELVTEEELVSYISNNISPDETYFTTAKNVFNDLLYEAKALAGIKYNELQAEINAEKDKNKIASYTSCHRSCFFFETSRKIARATKRQIDCNLCNW